MVYISYFTLNENNVCKHNVFWSNKCRSGKCGIYDDQRDHLLLVLLGGVDLVLVGERLEDGLLLGQGVAPPFLKNSNWMLLNWAFSFHDHFIHC